MRWGLTACSLQEIPLLLGGVTMLLGHVTGPQQSPQEQDEDELKAGLHILRIIKYNVPYSIEPLQIIAGHMPSCMARA